MVDDVEVDIDHGRTDPTDVAVILAGRSGVVIVDGVPLRTLWFWHDADDRTRFPTSPACIDLEWDTRRRRWTKSPFGSRPRYVGYVGSIKIKLPALMESIVIRSTWIAVSKSS